MLHKAIIILLVCTVIVLNVVQGAPNQIQRETVPHAHEDHFLTTNHATASLRHANDHERLVYDGDASHGNRQKRAIIFRPLFVYRQQEIKKQKLKQQREQQQQQQQQLLVQNQQQQSAACAACQQHQHSTRKPVRYYAQQYPYQRW